MYDLDKVLFIDTESNPVTKQPECLQWYYKGKSGIIEDFTAITHELVKKMWGECDAVLFFNAPYDMGVLSIMYPQNKYKWKVTQHGTLKTDKTAAWDMILFGNRYSVRKIAFFRNMIKPMLRTSREPDEITADHLKNHQRQTTSRKRSTPIVDLLKLWAILIDDKGISLKALIKKELHREPIPYSPEAAKSEAYRLQDVFCLRELLEVFFERITDLKGLDNYTWAEWCYIKTPATFTKLAYREAYPRLSDWKKDNDDLVKQYGVGSGLESAFHGGITLSFFRGRLDNTGWVDISGAYSKAIEVLNTDSYLKFSIYKIPVPQGTPGSTGCPAPEGPAIHSPEGVKTTLPVLELKSNILVKAHVNFMFKTVDKSLKIFKLKRPAVAWMWSDDLKACKNLYKGFKYSTIEAYEFTPEVYVNEALPVQWNRAKQEEKKLNGKTTRYRFHKFRSNTGYGITAQRKPFQTVHTNMVIAGMITSKVHYILTLIIKILEDLGYRNIYNDTDSACFYQNEKFTEGKMNEIIGFINDKIHPFKVESEGFNKKSYILSLKRYISERGTGSDKIRLHGKGRYNIKEQDIYNYVVNGKIPDKSLMVTQLAANTKIGLGMIVKLFPYIKPYKHPFCFEKNIPVDPIKKTMKLFMHEWFYHIDTKTSFKSENTDFWRYFHTFRNIHKALRYFRAFIIPKKTEYTNLDFRDWDMEIFEDFI